MYATGTGKRAEVLDFRNTGTGRLGGDDCVARPSDIKRSAEAMAVDRGDYGFPVFTVYEATFFIGGVAGLALASGQFRLVRPSIVHVFDIRTPQKA